MATKIKVLIVSALVDGFRRAGRAFSTTAQTIAKHELTEAEIKAIYDEPKLSVKEDTIEVDDDSPMAPPKKESGASDSKSAPKAGPKGGQQTDPKSAG